jgi:hypothetical protein
MSIDGSDANRIYQPPDHQPYHEPDHIAGILAGHPSLRSTFDAEARATLERDARDWSGAAHLPDTWIVALAGLDPHQPRGIDIDGIWVAYTLTGATRDPAVMCATLRTLRRVVADTPAPCGVPVIDRRLPDLIGSAHWHTAAGDVTVVHPARPRRRARRLFATGAGIPAVWALTHTKLSAVLSPAVAAAGVAGVATVTLVIAPATVPVHPHPVVTRGVSDPRYLAGAPTGRLSPGPGKTLMAAPAGTPSVMPTAASPTAGASGQPTTLPTSASPAASKPPGKKPSKQAVVPPVPVKRKRRTQPAVPHPHPDPNPHPHPHEPAASRKPVSP